jgi:hypothetical protein
MWFLYHLATSMLLMATTWFEDLSAAYPAPALFVV